MTKQEILWAVAKACPDMASEIMELQKRLTDGEFTGNFKTANEQRFAKLCRDALEIGEIPADIRGELEIIEGTIFTHGGSRPGSGRKPVQDPKIARSIKFSDEEWETVKEKASAEKVSASEYVRSKALEGELK